MAGSACRGAFGMVRYVFVYIKMANQGGLSPYP